MSPGPENTPEPPEGTFERAAVRPGRGLDATITGADAPIEGIIDRVLDDHKAVMAALHHDLKAPLTGVPEGPATVLRREREALAALQADLGTPAGVRADLDSRRRERERLVADLKPTEGPVFRAEPIVTRAGVLSVEADFTQARGLGPVAEARLYSHGIRSTRIFLAAPIDEIVQVTGLSRAAVLKGRDDLRLERINGLDSESADLLRVAGVHTVSDLASRDAALLVRRLDELRVRYRFTRFPDPVASEAALARLVAEARALSGDA